MRTASLFAGILAAGLITAGTAVAGPILLTGHDPDFHSQTTGAEGTNTQHFLDSILNYVTGGTYTNTTDKFLWVESRISPPSGHRVGEAGLGTLGLTLGTHYDRANAAELASVNFSNYTAVVVASAFGGLLTRAELDELIARKDDIKDFVNNGGGLGAFAECYPCGQSLLGGTTAPDLFGYLPLTGVVTTAVGTQFTVTAEGAAAPYNLQDPWVNSPTHNAFSSTGGLTVLDRDQYGSAVTIAGTVTVTKTGFDVPEPGTVFVMGSALIGLGWSRRRRNTRAKAA